MEANLITVNPSEWLWSVSTVHTYYVRPIEFLIYMLHTVWIVHEYWLGWKLVVFNIRAKLSCNISNFDIISLT